jgi:acetaldehyde dehydrogenase (acetylating)
LNVGIIGTGNIGTDLLLKAQRSEDLNIVGVAGIDPESRGLSLARLAGYATTDAGLEALLGMVGEKIDVAFDASSAASHARHIELLADRNIRSIDLTPSALGVPVVPVVNIKDAVEASDVSLVSCGAQATVPIVAAIAAVTDVGYSETVSTIASESAGPGTRANIDEFTRATARSLVSIGSSTKGKSIIVLNPASPPITMRNTIYCRVPHRSDSDLISEAIDKAVTEVTSFVPRYRKAAPTVVEGEDVIVFLEVEGNGDYLPPFAGNLDIMTAAAIHTAEQLS